MSELGSCAAEVVLASLEAATKLQDMLLNSGTFGFGSGDGTLSPSTLKAIAARFVRVKVRGLLIESKLTQIDSNCGEPQTVHGLPPIKALYFAQVSCRCKPPG